MFIFFQLKKKQNLRNQLSLSSVNRQFKIFLIVALSFLSSFNLSANDTFFSIEKSSDRIEELAEAGSDLYRSLSSVLKGSYDDLVLKGLNAVEDAGVVKFLDGSGKQLAEISGGKLKFKYAGFGGDIVMTEGKSTTVFGRFNDPIHGSGTKEFIQNPTKMYETGANPNGVNILNIDDWTWVKNETWVIESANRGDIIRFISDPTNPANIYKNGVDGLKTVTGLEIETLENLGYIWDANLFQYIKP